MVARDGKLTEPLETIVWSIGGLLGLGLLAVAITVVVGGSASMGGFGDIAHICVTQPGLLYGVPPEASAPATFPNVSTSLGGALNVCANHPHLSQRVLYTLVDLPGLLVWIGVIIMLVRLLAAARRDGPFTRQAVSRMRTLGWFIIIGTVFATLLHGYATGALLNSMLRDQNAYEDMVPQPDAIFPYLLVGAALLTFARFIKVGVAMDDDLKGTV
jgi:hypothetical protein